MRDASWELSCGDGPLESAVCGLFTTSEDSIAL